MHSAQQLANQGRVLSWPAVKMTMRVAPAAMVVVACTKHKQHNVTDAICITLALLKIKLILDSSEASLHGHSYHSNMIDSISGWVIGQ